MSDEQAEYRMQDAESVAKRGLALSAYCCRGYIDRGSGDADAESLRDRMLQWLSRFGLIEQLSAFERDAMRAPLGSLTSSLESRITWEAEGLAVLAWALGRGELPEHDGEVDPYAVTDSMYFLADDADTVICEAKLRSAEEILAYRELMYGIHCRLRDFLRNGGTKDFASWIEMRWLQILKVDTARVITEGDLGFKGQPIGSVEADQLKRYEWAISEQHRASIWLAGEATHHWETTADT